MAFRLTKRHHKIGLGTLLFIIVLLTVLSGLINRYWSPVLAKKVHSVVLSSSDSLYHADFSDAELHVLRGQLIIYNLNITPDTAVFRRRKLQHIAPNNLFSLHVRRLILNHIHPFRLYFKRKLEIGNIMLNNPEIKILYELNHKKDTVLKDHRTVWQKMQKSLHSIHIGGIYLNNVRLEYKDYSGNKLKISELKQMSLSANDLLIDSASQFDRSRLVYCKEIIAELNNYSGKTSDNLYAYKINHLKLSTLSSQLNVEGFSLKPVSSNFFNRTSANRYSVNLDSIELRHFDYLSYHKYRTVHADVLKVHGGTFSLFSNPKGSPSKAYRKINSFPQVALSNIQTEIKLDTLLVKRINVNYSEYNRKSKQSGTITFNNTSGHIYNITNNKDALAKNGSSTANLTTYFMNRGRLHVEFNFDLIDHDAAFSYKGELGPMDLQSLNPATMPFAMVKITGGTLKRFTFGAKANSHTANGQLELLYNDLKVRILKPDSTYGLKNKIVASLYANVFIIKHDNPDNPGDAPRSFHISYYRPDSVTFFGSIWKTLLSGIKPSAGVDKKTEEATAETIQQGNINKLERKQRRRLRKERRAEKKLKKKQEKEEKKENEGPSGVAVVLRKGHDEV
ncbi:MAG: hypothetical protein ACTHNW_02585 [Mucilaginibacter sp.]